VFFSEHIVMMIIAIFSVNSPVRLCVITVNTCVQAARETTDSIAMIPLTSSYRPTYLSFLADRTNGRAYATVLRLSVVCCL